MNTPLVQPAIPAIDSSQLGGFWLRTVAYIVDSLILMIPNLVIAEGSRVLFGSELGTATGLLLTGFFGFFYFGLLQSQMEGTLGKKMVGLALVNEQFEKLTLGQTMARFFMSRISGLALGLGYFWVAWDARKQGWHDKVAHTQVLRREYVLAMRAQRAPSAVLLRMPPAPPTNHKAA